MKAPVLPLKRSAGSRASGSQGMTWIPIMNCTATGMSRNRLRVKFTPDTRLRSSGMKAKLKVLLAISHKAKLLVLDEPTTGLDVLARNEVLGMLREYLEEDSSRSILISSHISSDLEGLCDDIYMIDEGRIIMHEDTDVLLSRYGLLKMSEKEYEELDKQFVTASKKEKFSITCLTNEKQFYIDNYPGIVVENSSIDDIIVLTLGRNEG